MIKQIIGLLIVPLILFAESEDNNISNNGLSPFGIALGKVINKNIKLKSISDSLFELTPPKPIATLDDYMVVLNNKKLVVKIIASTNPYRNDEYCSESKAAYSKLEASINKKYGEPSDKFDFLKYEALWKEPRDYKNSIVHKERTHSTFWKYAIYTIWLEESANRNGCYLILRYEDSKLTKDFSNDIQKKEEESL